MTEKLRCSVLGATGVAGQQFIASLENHPQFEVAAVYASERSAGKKYGEAAVWHLEGEIPKSVANLGVRNSKEVQTQLGEFDLVFSALPSEEAKDLEGICATRLPVISTASAYRYEADVPIIIPEVNIEHLELIGRQRNRGWEGFVLPGPNCTTVGLVISLAPIIEYGIKRIIMTSEQAISGAGYPGVSALDIEGNVIPYIAKEEEKVTAETRKILGQLREGEIENHQTRVSCTCTRVPVRDGHTLAITIETQKPITVQEYVEAVATFNRKFRERFGDLYSTPNESIVIRSESNRPQPKRDVNIGNGMTTVVGRVRRADVFDNGLSLVALSHNTSKGAAKGGVFVAEHLLREGIIRRK
jgi:aspartate-semialdehyde dehydrogenase